MYLNRKMLTFSSLIDHDKLYKWISSLPHIWNLKYQSLGKAIYEADSENHLTPHRLFQEA